MSKKVFNPYRDMLDIPSLTDENPTDYQLLGIDDFESDPNMIASAHVKRTQRIAELYQIVTEMSSKIDAARDRLSDPKVKEEYDIDLQRMGRAGVPHLSRKGSLAIFFSFVLSIIIVIVSTFYIYPMVATIPVENIGASIQTLPEFKEAQAQKEIDILKVQQEDVSTMDVNYNLPIDVDSDSSVDFVDVPEKDVPAEGTPVDEQTLSDVPLVDQPAVEEPALPEEAPAVEEPAAPEEAPAVEEPALPEEAPAVEEPALPEEAPAVEEPALPEEAPAVEEPAAPEEAPAVEEPAAPEETPAVEEPAAPEEAPAAEEPAAEKTTPETLNPSNDSAVPESTLNSDPAVEAPTAPKPSDAGVMEIPDLPPLVELPVTEPPVAPQPPVIPELTTSAEKSNNREPSVLAETPPLPEPALVNSFVTPTSSQAPVAQSSGVVLENVDSYEQFVLLGQNARTEADFAQLLYSARQKEEELMKEKQFQKAQQIADAVYAACARSADKSYRSEAFRNKELVAQRYAWWESVRNAQAKMDSDGTLSSKDASVIAQWSIEIENDWETGLKYLAMSENEQIRNAARNEILANQSDVRNVLSVANDWWNLAQYPIPMQRQIRIHASEWYAKALPLIADKQIRTLVEKRIEIAEQAIGSRREAHPLEPR